MGTENNNKTDIGGIKSELSGENAGIYYDGEKLVASGNGDITLPDNKSVDVHIVDPAKINIHNANSDDQITINANGQWQASSSNGYVAADFMPNSKKFGDGRPEMPLSVGVYTMDSTVEINNIDPNSKPTILIDADETTPSNVVGNTDNLMRYVYLTGGKIETVPAEAQKEEIRKAEPVHENAASRNPEQPADTSRDSKKRAEELRKEIFEKENTRTSLKSPPVDQVDQVPPENVNASLIDKDVLEQAHGLAQNSLKGFQNTNDRPFEGCSHGGANAKEAPSREQGNVLT